MTASEDDFKGNNGIGRYVFLPGSDGRAKKIGEQFSNLRVKEHSRAHNLYLGEIEFDGKKIDVASVSSGMGTPSIDIIMNELFELGARRFIRIGTAGSLQQKRIRKGAVVVSTASVRDESTSSRYLPVEVPAVASLELINAAQAAVKVLGMKNVHFGVTHSKDSLYAREFKTGPLAKEHTEYMNLLSKGGVIASEMEASQLMILRAVFDQKLKAKDAGDVIAGAILAIIGDDQPFGSKKEEEAAIDSSIKLLFQTAIELAKVEVF
jgi:uridine phosphorylase